MTGTLIVTGASRGIGAAVARFAARRGWSVCVNHRDSAADAEAVAADIRAAGRKACVVSADIVDPAAVAAMFETAARVLGPVRALVNNAGITGGFARVADLEPELLRRVLEVNVVGSFVCAGEAVRRLSTRLGGPGGVIVNLSSAAARIGSAGDYVHYAASKGAIDSFTIGLAREVADDGIRVNAVAPGFIETGIHAAAGRPDRVKEKAPLVPMKRGGRPEEVAEAVVWLLSEQAAYVTGAILPVGGGI